MKKIGIITHYYNSKNYGGVLQAYALCAFLRKEGYDAEQIQFDKEYGKGLKRRIGNVCRAVLSIPQRIKYTGIYRKLSQKEKNFFEFRDEWIPHSKTVYTQRTLKKLAGEYDLFITGSDQVWHPNAVCDAYLLDFGMDGIHKMSYAASISKDSLTEQEQIRYQKALADYRAISVREKNAVGLLQSFIAMPIKWVVDPVFLLCKEEWQSVIDDDQKTDFPYVACYFLGDDKDIRKLAKEYAENRGFRLVTIPFLSGEVQQADIGFGEEPRIDVAPMEFVKIIKNAEVVFTDSFHAMAFSLIFERQFFVFERNIKSSMSSRIESLAEMFDTPDHFCNDSKKRTIEYIVQADSIDYTKPFPMFETMRSDSIAFLNENIDKCLKEAQG